MSAKVLPKIERTSSGLLVVRLFGVPVNHDLTWEEAIKAGGPNTYHGSDIWKVDDKYPNDKKGTEIIPCISLVGFERSWQSQEGVDLIKSTGLPAISPRQAFAIGGGEAYPTLNSDLERRYLGVVSFETCEFDGYRRVPLSWFHDDKRRAFLGLFDLGWFDRNFVGLRGELQ